jgi:hypothetical protein
VSLLGRVAALRGELVIDSSASGTSIDITLPIAHPELDWSHSHFEGPA